MKIKNKSWEVAILLQITRKEWSMLLKKMGIFNEKINRSRCAMNIYTKNKNKTPKEIPGRPEKLSPRNKRAIIRDVRKSGKSVSQIQLPGDINVSRWTIGRTLKKFPNVKYSKGKKSSFMEETSHKGKI